MLKNTLFNREATETIARAIGELNEVVVYVGGAMVSLYIDDPAADDVRPTKDIDITLEILTVNQLESIRENLNSKGFEQSYEDDVICRFRYEDLKIDVMSTEPVGWAPANQWFKAGFGQAFVVGLKELSIRLLPLPYFLASKFDAFKDRGGTDPRTSHDFEDIVYLLNHTSTISEQILKSDKVVKQYLQECFREIVNDSTFQEAIIGNLYYEEQSVRYELIMEKIKIIL